MSTKAPKRRIIHNVHLDRILAQEAAAHTRELRALGKLRIMADFSPEQLAALQAKITHYVREGTCRVSAYAPVNPWAEM